jgi:excisionase family DNA binding protein
MLKDVQDTPELITAELQDLPSVLTVKEMRRLLRISRQKAYDLVHRRGFPAVWFGRAIRIPRDAMLRWLEEQEGATAAGEPGSDLSAPTSKTRRSR